MASRKKITKPEPRVVQTICSVCGEDWGLHDEVDGEVSTLECVRLLKAKIARTPVYAPAIQIKPYTYPWWNPTTVVYGTGFTYTNSQTVTTRTPTIACANVAA